MPEENPTLDPAIGPPPTFRSDGTVIHDMMVIGSWMYDDDGEPTLRLNLGWLRLAHVHVVLEDDASVERHRDGIAFAR